MTTIKKFEGHSVYKLYSYKGMSYSLSVKKEIEKKDHNYKTHTYYIEIKVFKPSDLKLKFLVNFTKVNLWDEENIWNLLVEGAEGWDYLKGFKSFQKCKNFLKKLIEMRLFFYQKSFKIKQREEKILKKLFK